MILLLILKFPLYALKFSSFHIVEKYCLVVQKQSSSWTPIRYIGRELSDKSDSGNRQRTLGAFSINDQITSKIPLGTISRLIYYYS